ncbi:HAMP domain-containing histidine kinase [Endozoicomonas sp. G2_1]|uniref:sensor histidine kinase n=1 Tax=Endozoicomonas sp. G2_1 TaxID=2821091 RepID=UPI001ADD5A98|nr:HAMP domain-containing histidine kinase [Endozoicomonas sp. G2_1]MBO9490663.1 HAMP domain-containing histidine kinase [Endozoicomonas sp. G2_1]
MSALNYIKPNTNGAKALPPNQQNNTQLVILLRFISIAIQVLVISLAVTVWQYQVELTPLAVVIFAELIFNISSYYLLKHFNQRTTIGDWSLFGQIMADVIFLSLLLYFSGGASNAFVSLLLMPIAIAAVTLPKLLITLVTLTAVIAYSLLLAMLPDHASHHVDMSQHFTGMWINFLFSALVVSVVVARMAFSLNKKERILAQIREEQLRQEKLLTLGVASVQVTHQIATPIASVQLLIDELSEQQPNDPIVDELQQQLKRCQQSLGQFRQLATEVRQQKISPLSCSNLVKQITEHTTLNFPELTLEWLNHSKLPEQAAIASDSSLIPAILNLIQNAQRANPKSMTSIEISSEIKNRHWHVAIRDFGVGFNLASLAELGEQPIVSEQGLGMAVMLSHVSLERLGIKLSLSNHSEGGAIAELIIPLIDN